MELLQCFTEGFDIKFIIDYLEHLNLDVNRTLTVKTEGWTNIPKVKPKFEESTDKEGINVVLFDADNNIFQRRNDLNQQKADLNIQYHLFLFPNDTDAGCIENLLIQIVKPKYKAVLLCFDEYCACISKVDLPTLNPNIKSKLFAFLEATGQGTKLNEVNFLDTSFWDLEHEALDNLRSFFITLTS